MNELIERAQNGDEEAMTKIINENVGLVWNVVKRFYNRGYDKEDLFQIGCLGFIKATPLLIFRIPRSIARYSVFFMLFIVILSFLKQIVEFLRQIWYN